MIVSGLVGNPESFSVHRRSQIPGLVPVDSGLFIDRRSMKLKQNIQEK